MDTSPFLLAFLLFRMRRIMIQNGTHPEWQKRIYYALFGMVVLWAAGHALDGEIRVNPFYWLWFVAIFWVFRIIYKNDEFQRLRNLVYAFLPLIVMDALKEATQLADWHWLQTVGNYLENVKFLAFAWLIGMLIVINRQNKVLKKEEAARKVEEQRRHITEGQKQQLEVLVSERTQEITKQKEELQQAVEDLKSAQIQLIHAEKMASLGELTAGIAHEIQNPLNFVNNFSDINSELIGEIREAISRGDVQEAMELTDDIKNNQEKISHHGRRADAIVKSMLQHSRSSSNQKEPADINALCDEYLRLSFHGLRAKDKSFNAIMDTHFDPDAGKIDIVAQDIGRVLLNLFNNAFYAVSERKKKGEEGYQPTVTLTTKRLDGKVRISVRDNGTGIPNSVRDKIFQPFFTTKPTGQGTGLGLSLSFDIITKGHGGKIHLDSRENAYTQFDITLPA